MKSKIRKVLFSSKSDDWSTPKDLFMELDREFHFTLDPCASDNNHKCDLYYTVDEDGLSQNWAPHNVFCNPPYGRVIGDWVRKGYNEFLKGATVVFLLPARTDTKWFHEYIYGKATIRFIKGRLKFGDSIQSAPFPSMIVIFKH